MKTDIDTAVRIYTDRQIKSFGLPPELFGTYYLRKAVLLTVYKPELLKNMMYLYQTVAELYGTTASAVERNIRNAVKISWDRGNSAMHRSFSKRPENRKIIKYMAEYVYGNIPQLCQSS